MDDDSEYEPESDDSSYDSYGNDMDFVIPNHQHFVNLWGIEIGKEGQREVGVQLSNNLLDFWLKYLKKLT